MRHDCEFAELLGAITGDGNLSVYKSKDRTDYKTTVSGHIKDDFEYLKYLKILFKASFNKEAKLKDKKRYLRLELSNKEVLYKIHKAGIPIGNKSGIVEIPKNIMKNKELIKSFLKGLADTEFSVMFKKAGRKKHSYPRISVELKSRKLIMQISGILNSININHIVYEKSGRRNNLSYTNLCIDINGKENLYKWLKNIGFRNKKHLTKIEIWKKYGYLKPYTSLKEREKILKL